MQMTEKRDCKLEHNQRILVVVFWMISGKTMCTVVLTFLAARTHSNVNTIDMHNPKKYFDQIIEPMIALDPKFLHL